MDTLLSAALQELAVEGSEGCSLIKLWSLIQNVAAEANIDLAGRFKQILWRELLRVPSMSVSLPKLLVVSASDPRIQPVESAERLGVHLVAPEGLRDSSLGLYDLKVCDARLSREQRDILERIAKSRTKGITQSQLSKEFKVAGNKIFYLVKMLEVRGLVVRQTTLVRTGESKTPIVATNLLHLTRYAKDLTLSSHQRFEILRKTKDDTVEPGDSVGDDGEGEDIGIKTKSGDYVIKDDFPAMEEICQKLEGTEDKVLVVGDLKGSLGYRKAVGHRNWRRLIKRLQDAGVVEVFNAQIDRKVRPCVRLIKSFDVKALSSANDEMESENTLRREKITEMVMELSVDQQIYHLVDQSGSDGVQMMEVFNRLGLQNKRNYSRIATMLARQCLVSEAENHKRSTLYRLKTVDNASGATAQALDIVPHDDINHVSPEVLGCTEPSGCVKDNAHVLQVEEYTSTLPKTVTEVKRTKSRSNRKQPELAQEVVGRNRRESKVEEFVLLNKDVLASVPPTRTAQHHSGVQVSTTTRAQREQRILEKLRAEEYILRVELHRWLEELENRKATMMDRKTLSRILQAFQRDGLCKCILLSMPGLTNCGRQRTVEVVLLPSITVDEEVLNKVHEKVRKFDMDCRGHGQSRVKRKGEVPVLEGVKRMSPSVPRKKHRATKFEPTNDGSWSMQANGFIPAKMVRVNMLHHFLWSYVNSLYDESELLGGSDGMGRSCRTFALTNAVQTMPLELFLQIIGSIHKVEGTAEWCKRGLRLSDLPKDVFSLLLDTNATGRLSWLVDVLRRLKLVRLVMGCQAGLQSDHQDIRNCSLSAVLTYAIEREPYLEEPAPSPLPPFALDNYDISPRARHEFSIITKDGLDAYWQTLEYFYSGAQPELARHAFPGSSVPELFGLRSWTSLRIMTTQQRTELLERIGAGGMDKRKSPEECAQIAKDLNLSLEQVLGVSYEKNRIYRLQTLAETGQSQVSKKRAMMSGGFAGPSHVRAYKKQRQSDEMGKENNKPKPTVDGDGPAHQEREEREGEGKGKGEKDDEDDDDDEDTDGDQNDFGFVANLKPSRQRSRRFVWSERLDRLLISAYVKQRAKLGARYPRVDWNTIEQLPAPPAACRRRMAQFRLDVGVRKAILNLCTLIAVRYVKHTESEWAMDGVTTDFSTPTAAFVSHTSPRNQLDDEGNMELTSQIAADGQLEAKYSGHAYSWDDMSEPFLAKALDEVIRYKKVAKASASKRFALSSLRNMRSARQEAMLETESTPEQLMDGTLGPDRVEPTSQSILDLSRSHRAFATARPISSLALSLPCPQKSSSRLITTDVKESTLAEEDATHLGGAAAARFIAAAGPTRKIRKSIAKALRKPSLLNELTTEQQVRKSIGVANAIEVVKLVLLNSINEKGLVGPLVDAVQRFKEAEVFTAVEYLREQDLVMTGQGAQTFVLSPKFFHDCSASCFPFGTGDQWRTSTQWLSEHSEKMEEDSVVLPSQQQGGQLSHLLTLVSTGEFALNPSLPAKDIGEVEEKIGRRPASQRPSSVLGEDKVQLSLSMSWACERRERGFPGIEVSLMRSNRTLSGILSKYCSDSIKGRRLWPERVSSTPVYAIKVPEQAETAFSRLHDMDAPGRVGDRDITSLADPGESSQQHRGNVLNPPDYEPSYGKEKQVLVLSAGSSLAEGNTGAGEESEKCLEQAQANNVMRSNGEDTIAQKCDNEDSVAVAKTAGDIGDGFGTENDLGQTLSTSGAEVRHVVDICSEQVQTDRHTAAHGMNTPKDITTVPKALREGDMIRLYPSLHVESSIGVLPENAVPVREHDNTDAMTRTSALRKCVLFSSEAKADAEIECARYMNSEHLWEAYRAIELAGEEGLALETLQEDLQNSGVDVGVGIANASDYVQSLESFGLVKRVNAFDHLRVLEISRSKRFHLNIMPHNNNKVRKRRSRSRTDTLEAADRQQKNFSSENIAGAGGSGRSNGESRKGIEQPSGSAASSRVREHRVFPLRSNEYDDRDDSSMELVPIVPWLNRHGLVHPSMLRSLSRRVMGIVALHPGIDEDTLIEQLNVLNPQSTRLLLQFLEADGHLFARRIMQPKLEVPRLLRKVFKAKHCPKDLPYMNHYFSNPMSGGLL